MAASALDMALEDVIKTKGGRRNNTRGVKKQALKEKPKQVAKKAPAKSEAGGAAAARPSALGSLRFAKGAAARAFGVAAKAAAAAAKATSTTTTPAAAAGAKRSSAAAAAPAAARKTGGGRSNAGATAGSPVKGTEAKLSMTLEDMIKSTSKKKPAAKAKAAGASRKGAGQQGAAAGPRQRLKLRSQGLAKKVAAKAKAKAKGKAKAKAKGKTVQAEGKGKGKGGGGGRGAESLWEDAWAMWRPMGKGKSKGKGKSWAAPQGLDWGVGRDDSWRKGGAGKGGWEGAAGFKRKAAFNDWDAMPAKRNRTSMHDIRASYGWGHDDERGDDIPRSRREVDRVARSTAMAWESERQWTRGSGGGGRMASDWEPPTNRQVREVRGGTITSARSATARNIASAGCRIKVTNVPRNLSNTDIEEAFEDVGIVKSCRLGTNGVAYITFNKAQDAKKAQTTFDRGELNNQMIYVSLCD